MRIHHTGLPRIPYLALAILAVGPAMAQINLKGRVLEKANLEPVPNALVAIEGSPQSTRTNANGEFTLSGASALRPAGRSSSPDWSRNGRFMDLPSHWASLPVAIEVFNSRGARIAARSAPASPAKARLDLGPELEMGRLTARYLRVSAGGESYRFPISARGGPAAAWGESMDAGRAQSSANALAKTPAAMVTLSVSADLLLKKTLEKQSDAGDIGDIILEYPPRRVDTGAPPIYGAIRLFDGNLDSAAARAQMEANWIMWVGPSRKARGLGPTPVVWKILRDPEVPSRWTFSECCGVPPGGPEWGYDDLVTKMKFNDYQLHIEFNLMGTPGDSDPAGFCNSGVYQQNRYELQIETIPSPWDPRNNHGMGSIINEFAPPANLSRPQGKWQAYDITFRNDRYVAGKRTESARTTIHWNGVLIHNNRKIAGAIACCDGGNVPMDSTIQGLKLQNEKGSDVRFRNIWMKPLVIKDTLTHFGY
jgi:hypothetical protein